MKRSAKLRRIAEREARRNNRVRAVIGLADDLGRVQLEPGVWISIEKFLESMQAAAKEIGVVVKREGNAVIYEGPVSKVPTRAAEYPVKKLVSPQRVLREEERTFEQHPFFSSLTTIRDHRAFFVRGPEEPLLSGSSVNLVSRRGALFVLLPDRIESERWYVNHYRVEHGAGAPAPIVERTWKLHEARATAEANDVIGKVEATP